MIASDEENCRESEEYSKNEKKYKNKYAGFKKFSDASSLSIMSNFYSNRRFSGYNYGHKLSDVPEQEKDIEFNMYA
jgi:hypothetical protein